MKNLNVRELRANFGRLDELVAEAGELIVMRRGKPIARIMPIAQSRPWPDHADLRAQTPPLAMPSATLIRAERDES